MAPQATARQTTATRNRGQEPIELSQRRIGPWSASALVVANMIGAGVFTTTGFAVSDLGARAPVLLAWLVGGVLALCGALSYGALSRCLPESGGEYTLLSRTIHPAAGFLAGWVSLLAGFTAPIAAAALGLQAYLADSFEIPGRPEWIGSVAIIAAGSLHALRVETGLRLQNAAVLIKLLAIAVLIVLGLQHIAALPGAVEIGWQPVPVTTFSTTLVWITFAYSGWNAAVYVAGEVRDPERNLMRSLLIATSVVTVIYLLVNIVFLYATPIDQIAGRPDVGAVAAEAIGGVPLRRALSAVVALALLTSISAMLIAGPRVVQRMASDGHLPALLARGEDAPRAATALQITLALVVVWVTDLKQLLGYIGFVLGLSAAATVAGLMLYRRRQGTALVPVFGYPIVPLVFIGTTLCISVFLVIGNPLQGLAGLGTILLGLPVYAWTSRRRGSSPGSPRPTL
jgi:APA family basic amino acid/polyamine antiporter